MRNRRFQRDSVRVPRVRETARRGGTAALELVLVLPLLVTIFGGAVDLGRIIEGDLKLSNAVRVGADYAAVHRYSPDQANDWTSRVQAAVLQEAANLRRFDPGQLTVEVSAVTESQFHTIVTVTASYPLPMSLFWFRSGTQVTLRHTVSMRQFR